MNERIRELAEQRGLTGPNYLISSYELEKFAELIIQDCLNIVNTGGKLVSRPELMYQIKKHFGVK